MAGFSILQEAAISFNGSGTFTLPEAAFVPSTPISSSAMNSNLSNIATNGLSQVICKDGQTTITGALKGASGSVGLPSYSFSADLDCGMYRIGANNIGIGVNGTKILDIATTGLTVTGAFSNTGGYSVGGAILAADGTVLLPEYSFTSDPDSGVYRIGANNLGVAVNATKILDISTSGLNVIGALSLNGTGVPPLAQAAGMVNGTIVESHAGNAVTFAIKTLAGTDPTATDVVYFLFRNVTAATGNYVALSVTAALSLTVSSGSTLGTSSSNIPFRLWLVAFNDASTVRLGVINCVSGTNIYPLSQFPIASAVAEGGAGGADSAQVFYAAATVTSKAYAVLGYAGYETGVTTAGTWAASPTRLELAHIGTPMPGTRIQSPRTATGAEAHGTTVLPEDDTIPQNTEGDEYMTQVIVPTSAANILHIVIRISSVASSGSLSAAALFQDSTANALAATICSTANGSTLTGELNHYILAATTSSTTFKVRAGGVAGTFTFNGANATRLFGGVMNSFIEVTELMA